MISVLIVDGHRMVGSALAHRLEDEADIAVATLASTGEEAVELAAAHQPTVVLLDAALPDVPVPQVVRDILQCSPVSNVVLVTEQGDDAEDPRAGEAIDAGCVGIISKRSPVDALLNGVRLAADGRLVLSLRQLDHMLHRPSSVLTDREAEVLRMLADGLSSEQIAERLVISKYTVRSHVQSVMKALGAHSRLEAVALARRSGLVP